MADDYFFQNVNVLNSKIKRVAFVYYKQFNLYKFVCLKIIKMVLLNYKIDLILY